MELFKYIIDKNNRSYNPARTRFEVAEINSQDEILRKLEYHSLMQLIDTGKVDHSHWLSELRNKGRKLKIPEDEIEKAIDEGSKKGSIILTEQDTFLRSF